MVVLLAAIFILSGCDKKDDTTPDNGNNTNTNSNYASFHFQDGSGVLVAIRSTSYQSLGGINIPIEINTATAAFLASPGSSTLLDAGTVSLNSKMLTKNANNSYVYQDLTNPLNFTNINWNVSGGNGIPAINYSDDKPWPSYNGYNALPDVVNKTSGLTVALGNAVSNADSVYVIVAGNDGSYFVKRVGGDASEAMITSADLNGILAGTGLIQVVPWNYDREDYNSKEFYFILEAAYTKMNVTIN